MFRLTLRLCALLATLLGTTIVASADSKIIVPYAAGGATDIAARLLAEELSRELDNNIIVENRVGAGGIIGATALAKSAPDGATLGFLMAGTITWELVRPDKTAGYDLADFAAVCGITRYPQVLAVRKDSAFMTLNDLTSAAKKRRIGIATSNSTANVVVRQLAMRTGTKVDVIPYRGEAQALTALLGGHIEATILAVNGSLSAVRSGAIRVLVVTSEGRSAHLPSTPTMQEAGVSEWTPLQTWGGLFVPAATPAPTIARLEAACLKTLGASRIMEVMQARATDIMHRDAQSAANFSRFAREQLGLWQNEFKHLAGGS